MKTLSNAEFIALMESGIAEWPPVQVGNYMYARAINQSELYRTAVPA